jgi:hypothetical protein
MTVPPVAATPAAWDGWQRHTRQPVHVTRRAVAQVHRRRRSQVARETWETQVASYYRRTERLGRILYQLN